VSAFSNNFSAVSGTVTFSCFKYLTYLKSLTKIGSKLTFNSPFSLFYGLSSLHIKVLHHVRVPATGG